MSSTRVVPSETAVSLTAPRTGLLRSPARTNTFHTPFQRYSIRRTLRPAASSGPDPPSVDSLLKDFDTEKLVKDVQDKWEKVEDKTSLLVYVGGAILVLFVGTSVVSAFDRLPLFPKLFQLVGLIYTSWFVYRYLLFKSSRQELIDDVEEIKSKITGGK